MTNAQEDFEALYCGTRDQILGYLLRRCSEPDDAADLLGEVYLVAWRRHHDLPEGDEARLWLYGVARYVLTNHRRGNTRRRFLGQRLQLEIRASNLVVASPEERNYGPLPDLRAALDLLADDDRELLLLTAWEQLEPAEIARIMGLTAGVVRSRLHRARSRLRDRLEQVAAERARSPGVTDVPLVRAP